MCTFDDEIHEMGISSNVFVSRLHQNRNEMRFASQNIENSTVTYAFMKNQGKKNTDQEQKYAKALERYRENVTVDTAVSIIVINLIDHT